MADWQAQFVDYANNDFHLQATSPYKNAGTDGKDLGADIAGIDAATADVITGRPGDQEIVIHAAAFADADLHGRWQKVADASAASGLRLENADQGDAKISPALASPTSYVEITFNADPAHPAAGGRRLLRPDRPQRQPVPQYPAGGAQERHNDPRLHPTLE